MPCYHPITAYYAKSVNKSGKRSLVFSLDKALVPVKVPVKCGRCIGCRLDKSKEWALRCVHEAQMHSENCFITLTFNEDYVKGSVDPQDLKLFLDRFRKRISPRRIRYFACGEYGEKYLRPHYHMCIFGFDFPDKVLISQGHHKLYSSEMLSDLWSYGFSSIGDLTFDSAAYVARYVLKKLNSSDNVYQDMVDYSKACSEWKDDKFFSGVLRSPSSVIKDLSYAGRRPEFVRMSLKPGIGSAWYDQFKSDIYPGGFAVLPSGKKSSLPRFYDLKYDTENSLDMALMKCYRIAKATNCNDNSVDRLIVREEVKLSKINSLNRGFENGR